MKTIKPISAEQIKQIASRLTYNAELGYFVWVDGPQRGRLAGFGVGRYNRIEIFGNSYAAHRLAWAMHYGSIDGREIDHINRNGYDNRIANLRLVDSAENKRNKGIRKDNSSGFEGVTFDKAAGNWKAQTKAGGKGRHLGNFSSPEEAAKAYADALGR